MHRMPCRPLRGRAADPRGASPAQEGGEGGQEGSFLWPDVGAAYKGEWAQAGAAGEGAGGAAEGEEAAGEGEGEEGEGEAPELGPRVRHGRGVYEQGGFTYEGDWVSDKMEGVGRADFKGGAWYEGQWADNRYHGLGKYVAADGATYEGEWSAGHMHGQGTYTTSEGQRFSGEFFNGSGPGLTYLLD